MKYFSKTHNRGQNLRPPDLYEYFVDNFWFKAADLENQKINEPLILLLIVRFPGLVPFISEDFLVEVLNG